ncbi:MAG: hypothetical protein R2827_15115 [Bdellovibrionales bacterium]
MYSTPFGLIADACESFIDHCVVGIEANKPNIQRHLENSLMLGDGTQSTYRL